MFSYINNQNKKLSKSICPELKLNKNILQISKHLIIFKEGAQYIENKWKAILQGLDKWTVKDLSIKNTNNQQIIKQISHISFNNLRFLLVSNNNIRNIQQICQIDFSLLQELHFNGNNISRIGCLHKLSMKKLTTLSMNSNPINQINSLTRIKFNDLHNLKWLFLQFNLKQKPISQTLQQILKLDAEKIQIIWHQQKKRIKMKTKSIISNKYQKRTLDLQF